MRISFDKYSIEITSHASRSDLQAKLQNSGGPYEMIETTEYERAFYSIKFRPEFTASDLELRSIGLCSSQTGIEPQLLFNPVKGIFYLGADSSFFIFDSMTGPTRHRRVNLDSPFYWMSLFSALDRILVVHEIGLLWLRTDGDIVWRHSTEIISSISILDSQSINVKLMEGGHITLDMLTGKNLTPTP
jgi:hypothetical protein